MVEDIDHNVPQSKKVADAVAELDKKFERDDVTLYLSMCAEQWPQVPELEASGARARVTQLTAGSVRARWSATQPQASSPADAPTM
jgi:hypothetical protein